MGFSLLCDLHLLERHIYNLNMNSVRCDAKVSKLWGSCDEELILKIARFAHYSIFSRVKVIHKVASNSSCSMYCHFHSIAPFILVKHVQFIL